MEVITDSEYKPNNTPSIFLEVYSNFPLGNVIKRSGIKFKILNTDTNEYVCQNITYPTSQKVCVFAL